MSRRILTGGTSLLALTILSMGLTGCSSSDDSAADSSVGGMAVCDEATLSAAITDNLVAAGSEASLLSLDGFTCADGWATTFPTIGTDAETAITVTEVFQAEGQFWISKDRAAVCGTTDMNGSTAYPADSQVPESIWQDACQTN